MDIERILRRVQAPGKTLQRPLQPATLDIVVHGSNTEVLIQMGENPVE